MTPQTYLVLIRDGRLALAVASELEDRLADEGWPALALVPAMRGVDFADPDYGGCLRAWQPGTRRYTGTPQVVALYEEGLLNRLASLGLAAYIGVPREEEWRVVHWDNDAGAMLLPVATARDLVDAVVDHTPWSEYATGVAPLRRRGARRSDAAGPALLSRKIAIAGVAAGVATPLLLAAAPGTALAAGPPAASAASQAGQAPAAPSSSNVSGNSAGGASAPAAGTSSVTSPGVFSQVGTSIGNFFSRLGSAIQQGMSAYGQAEITNAQANQAFANALVQALPAANSEGVSDAKLLAPAGGEIGGIVGGVGGAVAGDVPGAVAGYVGGSKTGAAIGTGIGYVYGLGHGLITSPAFNPPQPGVSPSCRSPASPSSRRSPVSSGCASPGWR